MKIRCALSDAGIAAAFLRRANLSRSRSQLMVIRSTGSTEVELALEADDYSMRTFIDGEILEAGVAHVRAHELLAWISGGGPHSLEIASQRSGVTVSTPERSLTLDVPDGRPVRGKTLRIEDDPSLRVSASVLSDAIAQVLGSVSTDDSRRVLTGVNWSVQGKSVKLVSTDSYRLSRKRFRARASSIKEVSIVLPGAALRDCERVLRPPTGRTVRVTVTADGAVFDIPQSDGQIDVRTRMEAWSIEDSFPGYEVLIPQESRTIVTTDRKSAITVLRRMQTFRSEGPIKISVSDRLTFSLDLDSGGRAEESVECAVEGPPAEIFFNPMFLHAGLLAVRGAEVRLGLNGPKRATVIDGPGSDDFVHLLMPIDPELP